MLSYISLHEVVYLSKQRKKALLPSLHNRFLNFFKKGKKIDKPYKN